ncbi:MAG: T9SS type A sorting domain-containing protein [Bacteroidetes bacterium]|nr:T9SS type A sorting domain-containing protein [Bacteroidota bacterium]
MRKIIFNVLLFFIVINSALSQEKIEPCYFDKYQVARKETILNSERIISDFIRNNQVYKKALSGTIKVIPVVVHIIHNGGTENISDAQIQSQIDVLNEDFRKIVGTNGDGNGVDTEIEFCLAKKTPDGKCTNGIVRIQSTLSNHQTYQRSMLKQLSYWDNTRYLNMYVVKSINGSSGILGYSSFPGGPPDEDGIVVRHNYFGRIGTAAASIGRTTTHEIGHWFGLYHTFNGGCGVDTCADGDYVCDTPPAANPNFGCPTINSCSIDFPDVNDQIQNYLDYSDDNCKDMFTMGQKNRMHATLNTIRTLIWSDSNLVYTGCDSGYVTTPCNVVADFTANSQTICVNNQILFTNKTLNGGISYQWYFPGGTPVTSTSTNPLITYNALGTYPVKLVAFGSIGSDSVEFLNYVTVTTPPVGQALPYFEGFESVSFPSSGITIDNPDGGITWERDTTAIQFSGSASAKINNLINTNYGQSDALLLPSFDFTSYSGTPYLFFKWAYAKSDPSYSDELIVLVSKDCGVNWSQVFYRTGTNLVTGPTQTTPYIPDSTTVWKTANVNLNTYATYSNVLIKIVNVTDGGNNLYVDHINLGSNITGIDDIENNITSLEVFPNPTIGNFSVHYNLKNTEIITISLFDALGKKVYSSEKVTRVIGLNKEEVSTNLPNGFYTLKIQSNSYSLNRKIIISK